MAAPDQDVATWIRHARTGDRGALDRIFRHVSGRLRAFVRCHLSAELRRHEEDLDVVQSTFREAIAAFSRFRGESEAELLAWLLATARNKLLAKRRYWQRARRAELAPTGDDADLVTAYAAVLSPSAIAADREAVARIEAAIAQLPTDHREVLMLARVVGLPHAEIATLMGRSEAGVRQLLVRAVRGLGRLLDDTRREID